MTSKERTYKERDNDEKKGKKRFLERMADDEEAMQEIKEFLEGRDELDKGNYNGTD